MQIHVRASNHQAAASVLESLFSHLPKDDPTRHAPGLVALAVALYTQLGRPCRRKGDPRRRRRALAPRRTERGRPRRAPARGRRRTHPPAVLPRRQGPGRGRRSGRGRRGGARHLRRPARAPPDDRASAAGLAAALAACDPAALAGRRDLVAALRPARELVAGVDVDALEAQGVARPAAAAAAAGAQGAEASDGPAKKRRKGSLPPSRRPKDFVEGREPADKERWLPLRERSYWRPKGKKGRARAAGLTQGGVVEEKEKSGAVSEVKKAPAGSKGKKKKGRK